MKERIENTRMRKSAGSTDITNQKPLSAGFDALVTRFTEKSNVRTIPATDPRMYAHLFPLSVKIAATRNRMMKRRRIARNPTVIADRKGRAYTTRATAAELT